MQAVKKPLGTNTKENIPDIESSVGVKVTAAPKLPTVTKNKQTKRQRSEEVVPTNWKDELGN